MRNLVLSFAVSLFTTVFVLYGFLSHYVKVVDGTRIIREMEAPLLKGIMNEGKAGEAVRKKVLIYRAFRLALEEQRGIVFVFQSVFKAPFRDVTDEVLQRTRYWYAYLVSTGGAVPSEGGGKQGRKPQK